MYKHSSDFPDFKVCTKCGSQKTAAEFGVRDSKLRSECKKCSASYAKEHRRFMEPRPAREDGLKRCSKCREQKPRTEFSAYKWTSDGRQSYCKKCAIVKSKMYKKRLQESGQWGAFSKRYTRKSRLKKRYGIKPEQYTAMMDSQDGKCAICGRDRSEIVRNGKTERMHLSVDHCHETKEIRGLLCTRCNGLVGRVEANMNIMVRLFDYLRETGSRSLTVVEITTV